MLNKAGVTGCLLKMDESYIESINSKTPDNHGAEGGVRRGGEITSVVRIDDLSARS